jgi:hypothetical protein
MLNDKKYKFIIETILDLTTNNEYDFSNYVENNEMVTELDKKGLVAVYCKYKGNIVFNNFLNKLLFL